MNSSGSQSTMGFGTYRRSCHARMKKEQSEPTKECQSMSKPGTHDVLDVCAAWNEIVPKDV